MTSFQLPLPPSKKIINVFHLSDIHIRIGETKELARYDEYINVFNNYTNSIKTHPAVIAQSAVSVITGDIFHHKTRLDSFSVTIFNKLIDIISSITPVYIILGNHDFRQDKPDTPDLITSILTDALRPNVYFMKETGHYVAGNIGFGLVSVQDTLVEGTSSGKQVDKLPTFPSPYDFPEEVDTTIALFHGTIVSCKLQNYSDSLEGYPLSWFNGYDAAMLGDVHLQQIHNTKSDDGTWMNKKVVWAYPGSLIQQNFGEEIINHGYLDWDLVNKTVKPVNIYNDYGMIKLKFIDNHWCLYHGFKLDDVIKHPMFPKNISIRVFNSYDNETVNVLKQTLENKGLTYTMTFMNNTVYACDSGQGGGGLDQDNYNTEMISNLNTLDNWTKFIDDKCSGKSMHPEWKSWIKDPENLQIIVNEALPSSLHDKTLKKNAELTNCIQVTNLFDNITKKTFKIKYLEWSWILCFKDNCWFNFDDMQGFTGLVSGKNGSGKTSFLETIAIALFGECTPAKTTHSHSASIIHKNKPSGGKAMTIIHFEYNGNVYHIQRTFKANTLDPIKLKEHDVKISSDALTCQLSGNKTTSDWIKQHIGSMDDFIQYTMMTQFESKDFFTLSDQDQIKTIESSQNIDAVNNLDSVFNNAIKNMCSVQSSIQDIYNHNLSSTAVFKEEEYEDVGRRIADTETVIAGTITELKALNSSTWSHIPDEDFDKNVKGEIKTLKQSIDTIKLNKTYEELLIQKGSIQNTFQSEIKALKLIRYDGDINKSRAYIEAYDKGSIEKAALTKEIDACILRTEELHDLVTCVRKQISSLQAKHKQPLSREDMMKQQAARYAELDARRAVMEKNIKKSGKLLKTYDDYKDKIQTIGLALDKVNKHIADIEAFEHPFNPDCDQCKQQLWKINLDAYELEREVVAKELQEVEELMTAFNKKRDVNALREQYETESELLEELEAIDITKVNDEIKAWKVFKDNLSAIEVIAETEEAYTDELADISTRKAKLITKMKAIPIVGDGNANASALYYEHQMLVSNQKNWLDGPKTEEIDAMIALHKKKSVLEEKLVYWTDVKDQKPKRDAYDALVENMNKNKDMLASLISKYRSMELIRKQHQELDTVSRYLNDLTHRIDTLQNMSMAFKEYRQYLFNSHILPYVLKRINHIVAQVSENSSLTLACSLDTVNAKTNSKTKVKDALNWSFTYDGAVLPIEKASGFQRFMFAMAMRVSLTKINARLQNRQLFIDEGFTTFDEVHLSKVNDMFESLKSDYDNIIIVSHLEEIKENIMNKIHIERDGGLSCIQFGKGLCAKLPVAPGRGRKPKELFKPFLI